MDAALAKSAADRTAFAAERMTARISTTSEAQLGRIARGGALNLAGAVVSAVSGFLLVVVVANNFSTDVAGMLFSATSTFLILVAIAALGTDTGLARFLLRYEAQGQHGDVRTAVRVAFRPVMATSLALALAIFGGAEWIAPVIGLDDDSGAMMLRLLAVAVPFASLNDFSLAGTRAFGRMRVTVVVDKMLRSVAQVVAVLIVGLAGGGSLALTAAWVLPYVVTGVLATVVARRMLRSRTQGGLADARRDDAVVRREFWAYTWPRSIARICQIAIQRSDIILVAALLSTRDAAIYTVATRFVVLGQFAVISIQQVLQPRFSELLARNELDTVRDIFKISTAWCMAMSWPLYLTAACAAPVYLRIFGSGYEDDGTPVVITMAIAMMLGIAAGPLDTLLLMSGRSAANLLNSGTALVVDIGLCLILIPAWGIAGAAAAWAAAVVTRNLLTFWQVYQSLGLTPFSSAGTIVAGASIACFAVPLLAAEALTDMTIPVFAVTFGLGSAGYLAALWFAREPLALKAMRALVRRRQTAAVAATAV